MWITEPQSMTSCQLVYLWKGLWTSSIVHGLASSIGPRLKLSRGQGYDGVEYENYSRLIESNVNSLLSLFQFQFEDDWFGMGYSQCDTIVCICIYYILISFF